MRSNPGGPTIRSSQCRGCSLTRLSSYLALLKAIDRDAFGVHVDMVNVINSPQAYFRNGDLIHEWFSKTWPSSGAAMRRTPYSRPN